MIVYETIMHESLMRKQSQLQVSDAYQYILYY